MTTHISIALGLALGLTAASCSRSAEPKEPREETAMVDPTMPSWAPKSCSAYHVEVVKAVGCEDIDPETRQSIKDTYEAANAAWHRLENAPPNTIGEIELLCTEDVKFVRSQSAGKCGVPESAAMN